MISRYLTEVNTVFNPFCARSKAARLFLTFLPANARQTIKIKTQVLPRASREKAQLEVKFKDGKQMNIDLTKLGINDIVAEVDRHSRMLARNEELKGN